VAIYEGLPSKERSYPFFNGSLKNPAFKKIVRNIEKDRLYFTLYHASNWEQGGGQNRLPTLKKWVFSQFKSRLTL
jgi:hypothetical protein